MSLIFVPLSREELEDRVDSTCGYIAQTALHYLDRLEEAERERDGALETNAILQANADALNACREVAERERDQAHTTWQSERKALVRQVDELREAIQAVKNAPFTVSWDPGTDDLVFVRLYALAASEAEGEKPYLSRRYTDEGPSRWGSTFTGRVEWPNMEARTGWKTFHGLLRPFEGEQVRIRIEVIEEDE